MKKVKVKPHNREKKKERDSILLQHLDDLYYLNVVRYDPPEFIRPLIPEWDEAFEFYKKTVRRATKDLIYKPNQKMTILGIAEKYFRGWADLIENRYGLKLEVEKTVEETEVEEAEVEETEVEETEVEETENLLSFQDVGDEFYDWSKALGMVPFENS